MQDQEQDIIVDPSAPDPDADPAPEADEHGEAIHPTDGLGVAIESPPPERTIAEALEPPQPVNRETRVETPADAKPPPVPAALLEPEPLPATPPKAPTLAELTEENTVPVHECHIPVRLISDAQLLIDYVNKNEWRMDKPRRKLDVSKAPIRKGYPIFQAAMRKTAHHPITEHWYAAALILTTMGIPIDDAPKADTDAILEGLS